MPTVTCACCGRPGTHKARGLTTACYTRHRLRNTLDRYPRVNAAPTWTPVSARGQRLLAQYAELVAAKASPARIRWELSLGERQIQRYAAAHRHTQTTERSAAA
ncbi:hypothetical protein ABT340_39330 [Streptosporangium sp. NPDC000239]|uniref:hypothetical protein n=1 Tax=Streptosporangium sp. NPDC000239 TaxID=3154248 RepID=UPI00332CFABE